MLTPTLPSIDQATSSPESITSPTLNATVPVRPTEPGDIAMPVTTTPSLEAANRKTPTVTKTSTEVRGDEWSGLNTPPASASVQPASVEATKESPRYDGPEIPDPTITTPVTENEDSPATGITPSLPLGPDQTPVTLTVVANHDSTSGVEKTPGPVTGEPPVTPIHPGEDLIPTSILTSSTLLTHTSAITPPDGLPITGINLPRQLNWASLALLVLLLGTGVAALLRSEVEPK
jgi:hypothetical protein